MHTETTIIPSEVRLHDNFITLHFSRIKLAATIPTSSVTGFLIIFCLLLKLLELKYICVLKQF